MNPVDKPAYNTARAATHQAMERIDPPAHFKSIVRTQPVLFKKLHDAAELPTYGSKEAAGADLRAVDHVIITPGDWKVVRTGLGCDILPGFEIQVRPRSGLAAKNGVTVLNAPGTIDSDYTGEIGVILINHSTVPFYIAPGDRIAQMIVAPVLRGLSFDWTQEQRETDRGDGGYGSTGIA